MKFVVRTKRMDANAPAEVVKAHVWADARAFMAVHLKTDPENLEVVQTAETAVENLELEWVGSDSGSKPNKHLRVREREKGIDPNWPWGKWRRWP